MIILNITKDNNKISILDLNDTTSTNHYYKSLWKRKYNVSLKDKPTFFKDVVKYLKSENSFIE